MVLIKRLGIEDAALLSVVGSKSLLESHGHSAPADVMQAYVDRSFTVEACTNELADENNIFYGAFYNGELAGYYKINFAKPHDSIPLQPVTYMERLYLLSSFYDLRLGQQLMVHAVDLSKSSGEKGIWLTVWKKNERAIRFYEKAGFKAVDEGRFTLTESHWNPTWIMWKAY